VPNKRDQLFLKAALKNRLIDNAQLEEISKVLANSKGSRALDVAIDRGFMSESQAKRVSEAIDQALPPAKLGGFEILEPIGRGTAGIVYRAKQLSLDKIVAVKVLHPSRSQDEKLVAELLGEARAIAKLNHPHIVHALDAGFDDGRCWFAMEFVEGETLKEKLDRRGKLSDREVFDIARSVAQGLAHAHRNGLLHRDLKPGNILIGPDGQLKIADLGLAAPIDEKGSSGGKIQGTPRYISPEQVLGDEIDGRCDLYSLGATLYHCLCGHPPFTGDTIVEIFEKHLKERPVPVATATGRPTQLDSIVDKLLRKNPVNRFDSADILIEAIDEAEATSGLASPRIAPKGRRRVGSGSSTTRPSRPRSSGSVKRSGYRSRNTLMSKIGLGAGILISLMFVISAVKGNSDASGNPTVQEEFAEEKRQRAQVIISRRIQTYKDDLETKEAGVLEQIEGSRASSNDAMRLRRLMGLLRNFSETDASVQIILEIESIENASLVARQAGGQEILEQAKLLMGQGRLWQAYLLLDDRPRSARQDPEINDEIEGFLSGISEDIDARIASDLEKARSLRGTRNYDGAIAILDAVGGYADPGNVDVAKELLEEIKAAKAEYLRVESLRRADEERKRYSGLWATYQELALNRDFKGCVSAALKFQVDITNDEIVNLIEIDLLGFQLLDQFMKDSRAQLEEIGEKGDEITLELVPLGNATRTRKEHGTVDHLDDEHLWLRVSNGRAVLPFKWKKVTDTFLFDLVAERHGKGSPKYLIPLGILFLYRGLDDIAQEHFKLATEKGTSPDTWTEHLEWVRGNVRPGR